MASHCGILMPGERVPVLYQRVGICQALGGLKEADELLAKIESVKYYQTDEFKSAVHLLLKYYCKNMKEKTPPCKKLKRDQGSSEADRKNQAPSVNP
jgi:hypothetical protein